MASVLILSLVLFVAAAATPPNRIVGGNPTTIAEYPWMLQYECMNFFSGNWSQCCAANILTTRYVLTAAHCNYGFLYNPAYRRVRAGTTYRSTDGVVSYVEIEINHPAYRVFSTYDSDIGLVRLIDALAYTPVIQQATIAAPGTVLPDNVPVVHAGWGHTTHGGVGSDVLLDTTIYTISNQLCAERYLTLPSPEVVTENMICAGLLDVGGRDACQGDSGGPLYYKDAVSGTILVGVVSWGHGCANGTFPGLSTAVAPFTNWIIENAV